VSADTSALRVSATALSDYDRCPALFCFRHVLGLKGWPTEGGHGRRLAADGAVLGMIVHDYLRTADLTARTVDAARVEQLVDQHMVPCPEVRAEAISRANALLRNFFRLPLAKQLSTAAKVYREVEFLVDLDRVTISGTIDLLFQDGEGRWSLVDYKTEETSAAEVQNRALGYRTQLIVYAGAAEKSLGTQLKESCLAFLSPGIIWFMNEVPVRGTLPHLLNGIRGQRFEPAADCRKPCEYRDLCRRLP